MRESAICRKVLYAGDCYIQGIAIALWQTWHPDRQIKTEVSLLAADRGLLIGSGQKSAY